MVDRKMLFAMWRTDARLGGGFLQTLLRAVTGDCPLDQWTYSATGGNDHPWNPERRVEQSFHAPHYTEAVAVLSTSGEKFK